MKANDFLPRPLRPCVGLIWGNIVFRGKLPMLPGDILPLWEFECTTCGTVDTGYVHIISRRGLGACAPCRVPTPASAKKDRLRLASILERRRIRVMTYQQRQRQLTLAEHKFKMETDPLYTARLLRKLDTHEANEGKQHET